MKKTISTIIFDLGGVLIDLNFELGLKKFYDFGYPTDEKPIDPYRQEGSFLQLEKGEITVEDYIQSVNVKLPAPVSEQHIKDALYSFMLDIPGYKLDMLRNLRSEGYRTFMLSNTNEILFEWISTAKFTIQGLTVNDYFDRLYLSYRMGIAKPEPEIFLQLIEDSDIRPSETLFIDDGKANIETARSLGFETYLAGDMEDYRHIFENYRPVK